MSSAQAVNRGRPASTCRGLAIGESEWCSSCLNPKAKATCLRKKGLWPPIGPASDVEATQKDCGPGDLANSSSSTSVPAGCFDAASQEADAEQLPKSSAPSRHPGCRTCASGTAFCVSNPNIDTSANITPRKGKVELFEPEDFWRQKATGKRMGAQKARTAQLERIRLKALRRAVLQQDKGRLGAKLVRIMAARRRHANSLLHSRIRLVCSPLHPSPAHPLVQCIPGRIRPSPKKQHWQQNSGKQLKLRRRPPGRRSDSWRRRGGDSGRRKRGRRPRHKDAQPWLSHGFHGSGSHGSHRCSSHRSSPKEECARSLTAYSWSAARGGRALRLRSSLAH